MQPEQSHHNNPLKAQWAYFFDAIHQSYQGEPYSLTAKDKVANLSGFWFPQRNTWIDVGPTSLQTLSSFLDAGYKIYGFAGFPSVMKFLDESGSGEHILEICNFRIYTLDKSNPNLWQDLTGIRLNRLMQYILGMLDEYITPEKFRQNTLLLAAAAQRARSHFEM